MKLSEMQKLTQSIPQSKTDVSETEFLEVLRSYGIESHKLYQELEMDSPYVDTHQDSSEPTTNVHFHSHAFYELLCIRSASGVEYLAGTERYKLQRGDIIIVPPGVSHCPLPPKDLLEPYIRDVIWISEEFIRSVTEVLPQIKQMERSGPYLYRASGPRWEHICELIHKGVKEAEAAQPGWQALVMANTITVLVHLVRMTQELYALPLAAEKPGLVDRVISYVEEHLSEKITLAEIAHQFYISESTITQNFRKKMGISFYRYVTQRRLIAAKLLMESEIPLDTVAEQVGFTDYSSFFRAFKQEYGISPRQYRKMQASE